MIGAAARDVLGVRPMNQQELRDRTKRFAIQIVRLSRALPQEWDIREMGKQLLRSGTSVAANYRACARARSDKEFCSKLGIVVEEADESQLWLELLAEAHPAIRSKVYTELLSEAGELTAIFTASHKTARANLATKKGEKRKGARNRSRAPLDFQIPKFSDFQITP
jgi:four helix bundle protein